MIHRAVVMELFGVKLPVVELSSGKKYVPQVYADQAFNKVGYFNSKREVRTNPDFDNQVLIVKVGHRKARKFVCMEVKSLECVINRCSKAINTQISRAQKVIEQQNGTVQPELFDDSKKQLTIVEHAKELLRQIVEQQLEIGSLKAKLQAIETKNQPEFEAQKRIIRDLIESYGSNLSRRIGEKIGKVIQKLYRESYDRMEGLTRINLTNKKVELECTELEAAGRLGLLGLLERCVYETLKANPIPSANFALDSE